MKPLDSTPQLIPAPPRRERGSSALEFALVFPLLITLLVGIVDFGRLQSQRTGLSSAAYEGARASAVLKGTGSAKAAAAVALGLTTTQFDTKYTLTATNENCATVSTPTAPVETVITLRAKTKFSWLTPLLLLRPPTVYVQGTGRWPCFS